MGGGASQDGNTPARTAKQAAATPFFGVFGAYQAARDPWATPEVKDYNHYFYRQTIAYLDSRGVRPLHTLRDLITTEGALVWFALPESQGPLADSSN